jgi:GNAT superfamily N-acetyltransferase
MSFLTVPLHAGIDRTGFGSGNPVLDNYIKCLASQDVKRRLATVYVSVEGNVLMGYYTLSNVGVPRNLVPDQIREKLPHSYSQMPATLIGRLAVDDKFKGQGRGRLLLMDALKRSLMASESVIGSYAVVVDPIDDTATTFYHKFGFIRLENSDRLFLPMKVIRSLM